jgi:hypothetical protein
MPKFYFNIGIPIYNETIEIKSGKGIDDVGVFVGLADKLKYKTDGDTLLYRSKFSLINLYTIGFVSIIKGTLCLENNKLKIVQRMNLTTVYLILLMIYILFTQNIDLMGNLISIAVIVLILLFYTVRNKEIREIQNEIETKMN